VRPARRPARALLLATAAFGPAPPVAAAGPSATAGPPSIASPLQPDVAAPGGCHLLLAEHRSTRPLARLPLDGQRPEASLAFVHSVLGTPVVDRYRFAPRPQLIEETFDGQGYGLPHAPAAGERLERLPHGWRLTLERAVDPLVVRPLPAQRMRLVLGDGREVLLSELSVHAIEISAVGCPARP